MTQLQKTETAIMTASACPTSSTGLNYMEAHARDLARKLDIVMGLLDPPSPGFNWPEYKTELAAQARAAWERTE